MYGKSINVVHFKALTKQHDLNNVRFDKFRFLCESLSITENSFNEGNDKNSTTQFIRDIEA